MEKRWGLWCFLGAGLLTALSIFVAYFFQTHMLSFQLWTVAGVCIIAGLACFTASAIIVKEERIRPGRQ